MGEALTVHVSYGLEELPGKGLDEPHGVAGVAVELDDVVEGLPEWFEDDAVVAVMEEALVEAYEVVLVFGVVAVELLDDFGLGLGGLGVFPYWFDNLTSPRLTLIARVSPW